MAMRKTSHLLNSASRLVSSQADPDFATEIAGMAGDGDMRRALGPWGALEQSVQPEAQRLSFNIDLRRELSRLGRAAADAVKAAGREVSDVFCLIASEVISFIVGVILAIAAWFMRKDL